MNIQRTIQTVHRLPSTVHQINYLALVFFTFLLFQSCEKDYTYEKNYEMESSSWTYEDTLNFDFDIADTTVIYNLFLEIEHTESYAFQNLYTKIHTKFPTGERIEEVLSVELADKAGNWLGNCYRKHCRLLIPIQQNAYFNSGGKYEITMEQYMRKNPLEGVLKIGFMLDKTTHSR